MIWKLAKIRLGRSPELFGLAVVNIVQHPA